MAVAVARFRGGAWAVVVSMGAAWRWRLIHGGHGGGFTMVALPLVEASMVAGRASVMVADSRSWWIPEFARWFQRAGIS